MPKGTFHITILTGSVSETCPAWPRVPKQQDKYWLKYLTLMLFERKKNPYYSNTHSHNYMYVELITKIGLLVTNRD